MYSGGFNDVCSGAKIHIFSHMAATYTIKTQMICINIGYFLRFSGPLRQIFIQLFAYLIEKEYLCSLKTNLLFIICYKGKRK